MTTRGLRGRCGARDWCDVITWVATDFVKALTGLSVSLQITVDSCIVVNKLDQTLTTPSVVQSWT